MDIRQYWESHVESKKRDSDKTKRTIAVVEYANEYENVCGIRFRSDDKKDYFLENVPVKILTENDQWFPSVGEEVDIEYSTKNSPVILCKHIYDYVQDIRDGRFDMNDFISSPQFHGGFYGC